MDKLRIDLPGKSYDIVFDNSFEALTEYFKEQSSPQLKVMIVTETNVAPLYLDRVVKAIEKAGVCVTTHIFTAGEKSKTLESIMKMYETALSSGLDRSSYIVALGGGVCGDMAGFSASTYMRGIKYIQVPTTLLSQVDSSVGGKTGVDFGDGKNLIGAFWQPELVMMNLETLKTLPVRELKAGFAEVIKYGMIYDNAFFDYLESNLDKIFNLDDEVLKYVIKRCCEIKGEVVAIDEKESGLRAILNYGHTIGHAIEGAMNFTYLHGECVALGMIAASHLSYLEGLCDKSVVERITSITEKSGLATTVSGITKDDVLNLMMKDKKKVGTKIKFVLSESVGKVRITKDTDSKNITESVGKVII